MVIVPGTFRYFTPRRGKYLPSLRSKTSNIKLEADWAWYKYTLYRQQKTLSSFSTAPVNYAAIPELRYSVSSYSRSGWQIFNSLIACQEGNRWLNCLKSYIRTSPCTLGNRTVAAFTCVPVLITEEARKRPRNHLTLPPRLRMKSLVPRIRACWSLSSWVRFY